MDQLVSNILSPRRMGKAVQYAFTKLESQRKARLKFMAQYCGRFYGHDKNGANEDRKASPINMIFRGVNSFVANTVSNDPKAQITTDILPYRSYADKLGLATNQVITNKIKLRRPLRKTVVDSCFFAGFMKTGISSDNQCMYADGQQIPIGSVFAERIDPDDMVIDPLARDWDEKYIVGHRFRMPKYRLLDDGVYPPEKIEKLQSRYSHGYKKEAAGLSDSKGIAAQAEKEWMDMVDLVEVYVPSEQIIITMPWMPDGTVEDYLQIVDYEGPDTGPYHMLGYNFVGDNLLPVAPVSIWYDLHVLGNRVARKVARQAEKNKQVTAYTGDAYEDAQNIENAEDGEWVRVDNVDDIKQFETGGVTEDSKEFFQWCKQEFSEISGNLDLTSGSSSQEDTATEAQILNANASVGLGDVQNMMYQFTAEVIQDIAFDLHTDPLIELPLVSRQPQMNPQTGMPQMVDQQVMFTPEMREGLFFHYNLTVKPYSMARRDPNVMTRRMLEFVQNAIPAAASAAQLLGPGFKVGPFLIRLAREVGLDEMDEFIAAPEIEAYIQMRMAAVPPTGKVQQDMAGGGGTPPGMGMAPGNPMAGAPTLPGGVRPGQPNPGAMGPSGGISPDTEQAMAQQETAAEGQTGQPSVRALALMRGQ
jgi:hypothetical protein